MQCVNINMVKHINTARSRNDGLTSPTMRLNLDEMNKDQITSKQKAEQLYNKYFPHAYPFMSGSGHLSGLIDEEAQKKHAKELAIICVDEMLDLYDRDYQDKQDKTYWHPYDFWLQVKSDIQTL